MIPVLSMMWWFSSFACGKGLTYLLMKNYNILHNLIRVRVCVYFSLSCFTNGVMNDFTIFSFSRRGGVVLLGGSCSF